jgi:hypothetical protein
MQEKKENFYPAGVINKTIEQTKQTFIKAKQLNLKQ